MGSGIAQVAAVAGYQVTLKDISPEILQHARDTIGQGLARRVSKGQITESAKQEVMSRIKTTLDLADAADADLVIEAIPEILELKVNTFKELDGICRQDTIMATNTTALPIAAIAAVTSRPGMVIGIHFMNPVPAIKGVEIISGRHTSAEVLETSEAFIRSLGKEPCRAIDYAGFVTTRLLFVMINEAIQCVMDGNQPEEVDRAMKFCANFPMGPLELCDLIGAEIVLHGLETLQAEWGERFHPSPLLVSMVRAGDLGRKTGRGFYEY